MKKFKFEFHSDVVLTEKQIWPDGDGPKTPTVKDVMDLIEKWGGGIRVLYDWSLGDDDDLKVMEVKV
jgi:hypothetical protein